MSGSDPLRTLGAKLRGLTSPKEILDYIDNFAGPGVDKQRVVIIADPARARRRRRQAIHPGVIYPIGAAVIVRPQSPTDREGLIRPAEGIMIVAKMVC